MSAQRNEIKSELQMITGVSSRDITFMFYQLVKDGSYFDKAEEGVVIDSPLKLDSFDDWFEKL